MSKKRLTLTQKLRQSAEKDLYIHKNQRGLMEQAAGELERHAPIIGAWVDEGPAPGYHREMQEKIRREWPTLADALDRATEKGR